MGDDGDWTWCTIVLIVILVLLLMVALVGGACAFALHIRGTDQRHPQTHACPECFVMAEREMMHPQFRRYNSQSVDGGMYAPMSGPVSGQHPMAPPTQAMQLTPYQQYMIAMNWSNLYKNYLTNAKEQYNQGKASATGEKS